MNLRLALRALASTALVIFAATAVLYFFTDLSPLAVRDRTILGLTMGAAIGLRGALPSTWGAVR